MASSGITSYGSSDSDITPPLKRTMPTRFVRLFREHLSSALSFVEPLTNKRLGKCVGVYAFYDFDGEPIYVGQTTEDFATRIGRHLRGQRSDTLAYRILDPFEVAEVEFYPADFLFDIYSDRKERSSAFDSLEYSVYVHAIEKSSYHAILNEKIPPISPRVDLPQSHRFNLIPAQYREDREHPDVRIARRAQTLARVAAVAHERGEVSAGLRRVIVIQAIRLADLAAARLAYAEGRRRPAPECIDVHALVGNIFEEQVP